MAVKLSKGQKISLSKVNSSLSTVTVGLGWDVNKHSSKFSYDLDAAAFLLDSNGKIVNEESFVFYNNLSDLSGCVVHLGDNLTGEGDGDDEQINVDLEKVPSEIQRIAFTVTIHDAQERGQNFSQISNSFIRIINVENNEELIRYDLNKDFELETAIVIGELYRHNNEWKFAAIGSGFKGGLAALCENFGIEVEEEDSNSTGEVKIEENREVTLSKISLLKEKVGVILEKKNLTNVVAKVGLVLDISGSMFQLYKKGIVQNIVERILAVASKFDDNGELDMWMYDHRFKRLPFATETNFENYINREILEKYKRKEIFGMNHEAPVMRDVINKYVIEEPSKIPSFIVFISDGGVRRASDMKRILIDSSNKPIFWQFVGIGRSNYGILKKLDTLSNRVVDNANFIELDNIKSITDEKLYDMLLNEFPMWLKEAKRVGII